MGLIATFVGAIGAAVLVRLLADDAKAWMPHIVEGITRRAARSLPEVYRDRLRDEWLAHLWETPGEFGKLITALGFCLAASSLRLADERQRRQVDACKVELRRHEKGLLDRHFARLPIEVRDLVVSVFQRRLEECLVQERVTTAKVAERAHQLASDLAAEISDTFLVVSAALIEVINAEGHDGRRKSVELSIASDLGYLIVEMAEQMGGKPSIIPVGEAEGEKTGTPSRKMVIFRVERL